jgi:WD40 repeat protein
MTPRDRALTAHAVMCSTSPPHAVPCRAVPCCAVPTGRIWDCRTGRSAFVLQGHVRQVLSIDFAPDGYHVATGTLLE